MDEMTKFLAHVARNHGADMSEHSNWFGIVDQAMDMHAVKVTGGVDMFLAMEITDIGEIALRVAADDNILHGIEVAMSEYANRHGVLASESQQHITFLQNRIFPSAVPGDIEWHYWEWVRRNARPALATIK